MFLRFAPRPRRLVHVLRESTSVLGLSLALAAPAVTQCDRPVVPQGGFEVVERSEVPVHYSDGVVARGRLIIPDVAPPPCGWPLVVRVHSLGAQRDQDLAWQRRIAAQGYAVWAYDVRGHGGTRLLNPQVGTTLYGAQERFDLAEQITQARQAYAGSVSATKLAVTGHSQGGVHAWMAAAQSGRELTVPGRGTVPFPEVSCIVGGDFVAEPTRHRVRDGTLFSAAFLELCIADPLVLPFAIDRAFKDAVVRRFVAQDPGGLERELRQEDGREIDTGLSATSVPILFHHAWHDSICGVGPTLEVARALPPSTPFRLVVSTVGHAVPRNDHEIAFRRELSLRWLERFLWDTPNGVENESRCVVAFMPLDPAEHGDRSSLWSHAHLDGLPPSQVEWCRLFTTSSGGLSATEPSAAGPATRIEHVVEPGFGPNDWIADPASRVMPGLLDVIPMSERVFEFVATEDLDVVGAPRVRLAVTPDAPKFQIAALLSVRLPGSAEDRMVTHWGRGVLDATPRLTQELVFELSPIAVRIPRGATVKLVVRNHWITELPHLPGLVAVPLFESFAVDVEHGAGDHASYLELPTLREPPVALVADDLDVDIGAPGVVGFRVRGDASRGGWRYLLLASGSGQVPATTLVGGVLPLHVDDLTLSFAQAAGSRELMGFIGSLDANGEGVARLDLTGLSALPSSMLGQRLTFAAWVYPSPGILAGSPSDPVDIVIR